ncbi:DUF1036 domain-containing protein [Trichocoleus desertorum AS-A10]|uniref:DUF1036 domain-containing protein n=1 Tax=Trichocoleus desertorum TaxID=1481672 RepID=UPI0032983557
MNFKTSEAAMKRLNFPFSSTMKVAILTVLSLTSLLVSTTQVAHATRGPVKLCNGDTREESIDAAIMYYNGEKRGWVAQGWYVLPPGKCALVVNYEGDMFVYGETPNRVYKGSGSVFCGNKSGFFGYQKVRCTSREKLLQGIKITVPNNGGGFTFTFGDPQLVRDDF